MQVLRFSKKIFILFILFLSYVNLFSQDESYILIREVDSVYDVSFSELYLLPESIFLETKDLGIFNEENIAFPKEIFDFINIEKLEIISNLIDLDKRFESFSKLETLGCMCPLEKITSEISAFPEIKQIALGGTSFKVFPISLLESKSLTNLIIDVNGIKKDFSFVSNENVIGLTFYNFCLKRIPSSVCKLGALRSLTIYGGIVKSPKCISDLKITFYLN